MFTPSPNTRGSIPVTPRRPSISGDQRPATSGGERFEPSSAFLRDALRDLRDPLVRARSTTPKRARPQRTQLYKDEWLQSSGDETNKKEKSQSARPIRTRRASDLSAVKSNSSSLKPLGLKEAEAKTDRLEKENWSLKHRIILYSEQVEKLNEDIDRLQNLEQTNNTLEAKITTLQDDNNKLGEINDDVMLELETVVQQLEQSHQDNEDRQLAIVEAAAVIQSLESRVADLEEQLRHQIRLIPSPQTDSDYYSVDAKLALPNFVKTPQLVPDSDYYSADTSPLQTPVSSKYQQFEEKPSNAQLKHIKDQTIAFNRELGIRSVTSKDSLFSHYLDSPESTPQKNVNSGVNRLRDLRKKAETEKSSLSRSTGSAGSSGSTSKPKKTVSSWLESKPLRSLYMSSDSSKQKKQYTSTSPYSENGEDGKSRSNPSIVSLHSHHSHPETHNTPVNPMEGLHIRSNSVHNRPCSPLLLRQNSTPVRGFSPRPSPATVRAVPFTIQYHPNPSVPPPTFNHSTTPPSFSPTPSAPSQTARTQQQKPHSPLVSPVDILPTTYAAPAAQTAPTYSATKMATQTHHQAPPPNAAYWPRRYPAWPPSAGLSHRNLLFHDHQDDSNEDSLGSSPES